MDHSLSFESKPKKHVQIIQNGHAENIHEAYSYLQSISQVAIHPKLDDSMPSSCCHGLSYQNFLIGQVTSCENLRYNIESLWHAKLSKEATVYKASV